MIKKDKKLPPVEFIKPVEVIYPFKMFKIPSIQEVVEFVMLRNRNPDRLHYLNPRKKLSDTTRNKTRIRIQIYETVYGRFFWMNLQYLVLQTVKKCYLKHLPEKILEFTEIGSGFAFSLRS